MARIDCERVQVAETRRMAYSFFADVFSVEATKEFVAGMVSFEATPGTVLSEFVSSLDGTDLEAVTSELRSEFCALFLNMSAHPVFTSESVYLSDNHIIMQEPRNQVVDFYRANGLAVDGDSFDWPEDHISMEMLFMAHLCGQEADLCRRSSEKGGGTCSSDQPIEKCLERQRLFFSEHLDRWVPVFAKELARIAETRFYSGVAEYLEEFLRSEREYLGTL